MLQDGEIDNLCVCGRQFSIHEWLTSKYNIMFLLRRLLFMQYDNEIWLLFSGRGHV